MTDAAGTDFVRHAIGIEAIVAGQGLGLCSDVLVARELRDGVFCVSAISFYSATASTLFIGSGTLGAALWKSCFAGCSDKPPREADCQAMRVREALVALFEFLSHVGPNFC